LQVVITPELGINFSTGFLMKRRVENISKTYAGAMASCARVVVRLERPFKEVEVAGSVGIAGTRAQ
jgi:hypothetical protein